MSYWDRRDEQVEQGPLPQQQQQLVDR